MIPKVSEKFQTLRCTQVLIDYTSCQQKQDKKAVEYL